MSNGRPENDKQQLTKDIKVKLFNDKALNGKVSNTKTATEQRH